VQASNSYFIEPHSVELVVVREYIVQPPEFAFFILPIPPPPPRSYWKILVFMAVAIVGTIVVGYLSHRAIGTSKPIVDESIDEEEFDGSALEVRVVTDTGAGFDLGVSNVNKLRSPVSDTLLQTMMQLGMADSVRHLQRTTYDDEDSDDSDDSVDYVALMKDLQQSNPGGKQGPGESLHQSSDGTNVDDVVVALNNDDSDEIAPSTEEIYKPASKSAHFLNPMMIPSPISSMSSDARTPRGSRSSAPGNNVSTLEKTSSMFFMDENPLMKRKSVVASPGFLPSAASDRQSSVHQADEPESLPSEFSGKPVFTPEHKPRLFPDVSSVGSAASSASGTPASVNSTGDGKRSIPQRPSIRIPKKVQVSSVDVD